MIREELQFDITTAQDQITSLDDQLQRSAELFKVGLADALDILSGVTVSDVDAGAVTDAITTAVDAAASHVAVVDGDAGGVESAIDDAIDAAHPHVEIEADTSGASAALDDLTESATSAGGGLDTLGDGGHHASEGVQEAFNSVTLFEVAAQGAEGHGRGLLGLLSELSVSGGEAAVAVGGLAAITGGLFHEAVAAVGAEQRLDQAFGRLSGSIETINVGNLNIGLSELAIKLGTTSAQIQNAASTLQQMGTNAGVAADKVEVTTEQFIALAARGVALNPALGSVSSAAESLGVRLARGGRFANRFGISLTAAEITARALADTGKATAAELTIYEKSAAGAAIATEKYGSSLQQVIDVGAENAVIKLSSIKAAFTEATETIGKPLVAPIFTLLQDALPAAEHFAQAFASTAEGVIPVVDSLATVIAAIPQPVLTAGVAFGTFALAVRGIAEIKFVEGIITGITTALTTSTVAEAEATVATLALATADVEATQLTLAFGEAQVEATQLTFGFIDALLVETVAAETATTAIAEMGVAAEVTAAEIETSGEAMAVANPIIYGIAAALALVTIAFTSASARAREHKAEVEKTSRALDDMSKSVTESIAKLAEEGDTQGTVAEALIRAGQGYTTYAQAVRLGAGATDDFIARVVAVARAAGEDQLHVIALGKALHEQADIAQEAARSQILLARAGDEVTRSELKAAVASNTGKDGVTNYLKALDALRPAITAHEEQLRQQEEADRAAAQAQTDLENQTRSYQMALADVTAKFPAAIGALDALQTRMQQPLGEGQLVLYAEALDTAHLSQEAMAASAQRLGITVDELQGFINETVAAVNKYATDITSKLPEVGNAFKVLHDTQGKELDPTELLANLQEQKNAINTFQINIQQLVDAGASQLADDLANQGADAAGGLTQSIVDAMHTGRGDLVVQLEGAARDVAGATDSITERANNVWAPGFEAALGTAGIDAVSKFSEGVNGLSTAAETALTKSTDTFIGESALQAAAGAVGSGASTNFKTGVDALPGHAGTATSASGAAITTAAGDVKGTAKTQGGAVGEAFGGGIAAGIRAYIDLGFIQEAAAEAVHVAAAAARNAAVAKSPSRLFMAVGEDMGAGLVLGFTSAAESVVTEAQSIVARSAIMASAAAPSGGRGGTGGSTSFDVTVHVDARGTNLDDAGAQHVGELVGDGFAESLARRGILVQVGTGNR